MIRKLIPLLLALLGTAVGSASVPYDFSSVSPSGHTLFYKVQYGHAVVVAEMWANGTVRFQPQNVPTGHVVIPATVTHGGHSYPVTRITGYVFSYCSAITAVTLPPSLDTIGDGAFRSCFGLQRVVSLAPAPPTLLSSACFQGVAPLDLTVPAGSVAA